jgi:hypothetical protein
VIAGHNHTFSRMAAGTKGAKFPTLVIGQDQVARVDVTPTQISVTLKTPAGEVVDTFTVPRKK